MDVQDHDCGIDGCFEKLCPFCGHLDELHVHALLLLGLSEEVFTWDDFACRECPCVKVY